MNKYIYSIITFFAILFCGCAENKQEFTLKGKLQGLNSDTIIAFYQMPDYKLDTIVAIDEEFKYTFTPDTFTIFTLFLKNGNELPVFADKDAVYDRTIEIDLSMLTPRIACPHSPDNVKAVEELQEMHTFPHFQPLEM